MHSFLSFNFLVLSYSSHLFQFIRQIVERWMAVYFIIRRLIQRSRFIRARCMNVFAFNYPDADSFLSSRVNIPRIFNRHFCIRSVQTSHVLVIKPLLAPDEYFPKRPGVFHGNKLKLKFLFRKRHRRLPHPFAIFMRFDPCCNPFFIAGPVSIHHLPEFMPVDRTKIIVLQCFIPF